MKTKILLITIMAAFALSFSAQAQRFGDDIVLHECNGAFWAKPKISVAGNGWIYVLMNKYGHSTENDETRIFRSKDGGATFQQVYFGTTPSDRKQGGRDLVVTGDNESNINIWYLYADNITATNETIIYLIKMDANGNGWTSAYSLNYSNTITKDVAISTNERSPEGIWSPFAIGFALTTYTVSENRGNVDYVYSTDGGTTFTKKWMYHKDGSQFGSVDISIGQALASSWWPFVGIVFEMDKDVSGKGNIGFIASVANGGSTTEVLQVNKKLSDLPRCKQPKIQWLCNNTLDEPHNFMIAYTDIYNDDDYDIIKIYPTVGYDLSHHTMDNLDYNYISASSDAYESYPDLSYDKNYNNYLLAYTEKDKITGEYKIVYKVQHYTKIDQGADSWSHIGDVSTVSTGDDLFFSPVVDIDLTRTQACLAFEYYNNGISPTVTKLLFDSEWSTLDVDEITVENKQFTVSPNPATDKITLRLPEEGVYSARIYNMIGTELATFRFAGTEFTRDITALPAGMYLIKLNTEKGKEFTAKFIVK